MHLAKAFGRLHTFEAPHRPAPLFDTSMVLFQMIIQIAVGTMADSLPHHGSDSSGICLMPVGGHLLRKTACGHTGGPKERFRRRAIALLTQPDIDQVAVTINCPVEVGPVSFH